MLRGGGNNVSRNNKGSGVKLLSSREMMDKRISKNDYGVNNDNDDRKDDD